jgi:hypothetical protein
MEVIHDTPFIGSLDAVLDKDGSEARVALLKATYEISKNGSLEIAEEQEPICFVDEYLGESGLSSVIYEGDGAYFKPATDIVVIGKAYAPRGKNVKSFNASLSVGKLSKTVAVIGDRHWHYSSIFGVTMSSPKLFSEMLFCWEKAFGGTDTFHRNSKKYTWEKRNPVGTGFRVTKSAESLDGLALPNFEDPKSRIKSWKNKPIPQGFGFIGRSWMPRIQYAGTYDEAWQKHRMPILPLDFDYRFFNSSSSDLVYPGYLRGGEVVKAVNLSKRGIQQFVLPCLKVKFRGTAKRKPVGIDGRLDTVVFKFDENKVVLVWRSKYTVFMNETADAIIAEVAFLN